jgi:hypothetical protein
VLVALAITAWGWQSTAKIMGLVLLSVILPLSCLIPAAPERLGLTMDGDLPGSPPYPARLSSGAAAGRRLAGVLPKHTACARPCIPGPSGT